MSSDKTKDEQEKPEITTQDSGYFPFNPIYLLIPIIIGIPTGLVVFTYFPFYPNLEPVEFSLKTLPQFNGALEPNNDLDDAELVNDELVGAESIVFVKDSFYTGLLNGKIMKISGSSIETIIDCDEKKDEDCGRPLGLRADKEFRNLYVADCVKGLYQIDIESKNTSMLHPAMTFVSGHPSALIDDVTVTSEGDVYFTDASTKWGFGQMHFDFIELAPNGRILHYDPRTKTTRILLDNLYFPNGIQLEPDENSLLFIESSRFRILRYYLRGPNRGGVEVFADNLPGIADNIRASGRGTYWVAILIPHLNDKSTILELGAPYPWIRKIVTRAFYAPTIPFQIYDYLFKTSVATPVIEFINSLILSFTSGIGRYGLVIEINSKGEIIRSLHSQKPKVHSLSQVTEYKNNLYLGSPWINGIWKLSLKKSPKK